MCDGDNFYLICLFLVDDEVRKTPQQEYSRTVRMTRIPVGELANVLDSATQFRKESFGRLSTAICVPLLRLNRLVGCFRVELDWQSHPFVPNIIRCTSAHGIVFTLP